MDGQPLLQSDDDTVFSSGNYVTATRDDPVPLQQQGATSSVQKEQQKRWELNYHEAAIYLQEGNNNDKFTSHPTCLSALPTYLITHNVGFYLVDLAAALGLLILTLFEPPTIDHLKLQTGIHTSIELLCLMVIGLELGMRLKWLGPRSFFSHVRTVIKFIALLVMLGEAIAVLIRQTSHVRVTRAIRPIFLLDSYYMRGVRRFSRQIIMALPPILNMLVLLLFFMLIFSILGFYLFSRVPNDQNFQTIQQSFISLFILLTTANFPDVMMPAFAYSRWSALFFITYLALELYFLMNLLLAVVYDAFSRLEKEKVKKLWQHKRTACKYAFKLLISKQYPTVISLRHFSGLLSFYKPHQRRLDTYLIFKYLNVSKSGFLSLEEFYNVYDIVDFKWKKKQTILWSERVPFPLNKIFRPIRILVTNRFFEYFIYLVIATNFVVILVETVMYSVKLENNLIQEIDLRITWYSILFVTVYAIEALLKIIGLGPVDYFSGGWNIFDFCVTLSAIVGLLLQLAHSGFYYIVVLRPFRLFRLFKVRRSFRDVLGTFFILLSHMTSLAVVMLILYFCFAIIGMEALNNDMVNCCKNSSVEANYVYDPETGTYGYYYLSNFRSVISSYITLFELTVVNNWFIIMEGYAVNVSKWSRLYFMVFYISTMVVLTVVVAFILEAFLFRIQYRTKMDGHDMDDDAYVRVEIVLTNDEVRMVDNKVLPFTGYFIQHQILEEEGPLGESAIYRGDKVRGKNDFSLMMYADELQEWRREEENEVQNIVQELENISIRSDRRRRQRHNTIC